MLDLPLIFLVAGSLRGERLTAEETAFLEKLFDEYGSSIHTRICQKVRSEHDAADLEQNCCLKLAENVQTLMDLQRFQVRKYISMTIRNSLIDYWKKASENNIVSIDEYAYDIKDEQLRTNPEDKLEWREKMLVFTKAWESLSPKDRVLIEYRYMDSLTDREIARLLNIKESAVREAVYRAKKHLLKKLR